ncbi:MAG TPA: hypothetical protein VNO26_16465 [Candidatus Limnocylindria bacterium]|nr:hypothetical protein [Candidatus Limnocylindria bacterium]
MRAVVSAALMAIAITAVCAGPLRAEDASPEATLKAYLGALKEARFEDAYDHCSKAMRQGKSKEEWVKDQKALMAFADVKIFNFTVYPGKVEGDKAQVPNILESQDKFVNTLGLTEYELYTLVREDGGWRVDQQMLVETPDVPKWFPKDAKKPAG